MKTESEQIYNLRTDHHFVHMVQDATLHTDNYGIVSEHGLFGSKEWWAAIDNGKIKKHTLQGVVTRVYMSGHNDFPEFELESVEGNSSWEIKGDQSSYKPGCHMKIEYVLTTPKKSFIGDMKHKTIIGIWIKK